MNTASEPLGHLEELTSSEPEPTTLGRLFYIVLTPDGDSEANPSHRYTPFQGFGNAITDISFPTLLHAVAVLPAHALEIFLEPAALPDLRRPANPKKSALLDCGLLEPFLENAAEEGQTIILIGLPNEVQRARAMRTPAGTLFLSTTASEGVVGIHENSLPLAQILDGPIKQSLLLLAPAELKEKVESAVLRAAFEVSERQSMSAGVTLPNEFLAESLAIVYGSSTTINSADNGPYEEAILDSATYAQSLVGDSSTDIILYSPSIVRGLYKFDSAYWNNLFRLIRSRFVREFIKLGVFRNPGYSGYGPRSLRGEQPENPYDDPVAGEILRTRQTELHLTACGVAALACSGVQPAIRMPNVVNFLGSHLVDIERYAGGATHSSRLRTQYAFKKLSARIAAELSPEMLQFIKTRADAITLVSDAPIEWLRVDGLPLMIRNEMSRIGMTPGNQMLEQTVRAGVMFLPAELLLEVLVIRSFQDTDRIKPLLKGAIDVFKLKNVRVTVVDVDTRDDLISALNQFAGMIVVFDCHGGHDGADGNGWLKIGREKVDAWQLAHIARVPPIVVLSACSTFALAGSHASVGNGLLRSGAITVIGTFLPVDALNSSTFVARLLYRVDAFLPALRLMGTRLITWRTLVSTFLRMTYATDVIRFFSVTKGWLTSEHEKDIGIAANSDVNGLNPEWYDQLLQRIADASGQNKDLVASTLAEESPLLETMYYCQIGRPETLHIYLGEDHLEDTDSESDSV